MDCRIDETNPHQRYCRFPCQHPNVRNRTGQWPDGETGTGRECLVPLEPAYGGRPGWTWDGNREAPTLTPSIQCLVEGCGFHGYVEKGEVVKR